MEDPAAAEEVKRNLDDLEGKPRQNPPTSTCM